MLDILEMIIDILCALDSPESMLILYWLLMFASALGIIFGPGGGDSRLFFSGIFSGLSWLGVLVGVDSDRSGVRRVILTGLFVAGLIGVFGSMLYHTKATEMVTVTEDGSTKTMKVAAGYHWKSPFAVVTTNG